MSEKWSAEVTKNDGSLDVEPGVFTLDDPKKIAESLYRSAERSTRRKGSVEQSAMSMLNFYINRAGKNLSTEHRAILEQAKLELHELKD